MSCMWVSYWHFFPCPLKYFNLVRDACMTTFVLFSYGRCPRKWSLQPCLAVQYPSKLLRWNYRLQLEYMEMTKHNRSVLFHFRIGRRWLGVVTISLKPLSNAMSCGECAQFNYSVVAWAIHLGAEFSAGLFIHPAAFWQQRTFAPASLLCNSNRKREDGCLRSQLADFAWKQYALLPTTCCLAQGLSACAAERDGVLTCRGLRKLHAGWI